MADVNMKRILYMEDNPALSRLLQKGLQRRGFFVDVASNGEEGLAVLETSSYDILLVDYNMPYCGGLDVIRALSAQGKSIPIIMVTGQGNEDVAVEALKLGASDYIVKDVQMKYLELLPAVIEKVLHKQQLINERQQMLRQIEESEERYRKLVEMSPDGIALHVDGSYVFMNPAGAWILGASSSRELIGKSALEVVHPDYHEIEKERLRKLEQQGETVPWIEERYSRLDGKTIDVEVSGSSFLYQGKQAVQVIFRDITERKLAAQRLEQLALYDTLTGLPNRTLFFDRMSQLLALAKRNDYVLALLYIDFDGFKKVNDTLGHDVGDLLLREAALRMTKCTRRADTVARMGGDEFIGICGRIAAAEDAGVVAKKINSALSMPFYLGGKECNIGASIGISLYPQDGEDVDTLLKKADTAMYRVKERGKGGFAFYLEPTQEGSR